MVRKLYKQEMIYYVRSLLIVYIVLMGLSVMGGIIHMFESDHWTYSVVASSSLVTYVLAIIVTMIFTTIFIVIRYYKNMFTGEGYLTLTLPVTFEQHLVAKLLAAMTAYFGTLVVVFISALVFLGREWIVEICKAADYILDTSFLIEEFGVHFGLYIAEFVLLTIVAVVSEILGYYVCISLGQMFRKRRILAAIAIYYGSALVLQVITTIASIVITIAVESMDLTAWAQWMEVHYKGFVHGCLLGGIVLSVIVSTVMFFICRMVLKKKLNLE